MAGRKALLLIDFQRDFLAESGKMPVARAQIEPVIAAANVAVAQARSEGAEIVAIGNEFRRTDWIANIFRKGAAIAGSEGARWDERVDRAGAFYFPKWQSDAFGNPALNRFLGERGVNEVILAGLYADACVTATAKAALSRGFKVRILADAVAAGSDSARAKALTRLAEQGATIV